MTNKLFDGIPQYVKITIYSQTRYLLRSFRYNRENDRDDIIQDLLLFYLENFHKKDIPSEAYVVASLQNEAKRLIKTKVRERFGLLFSLDYLMDTPEELIVTNKFNDIEINLLISAVSDHLSDKENLIIKMILEGKTSDEITRFVHISKTTIYKTFEKIKIFLKK